MEENTTPILVGRRWGVKELAVERERGRGREGGRAAVNLQRKDLSNQDTIGSSTVTCVLLDSAIRLVGSPATINYYS